MTVPFARAVATVTNPREISAFRPEVRVRKIDHERTQEIAGRFRRVAVPRKIQGLRVPLTHRQAPAGTGMVTGWRLTDALATAVTY
jgi:hypothetical protein